MQSDQAVIRFAARARKYAIGKGMDDNMADDVQSFAAIEYIKRKKKGQKAKIGSTFVEFIRSEFGRYGHKRSTVKAAKFGSMTEKTLDCLQFQALKTKPGVDYWHLIQDGLEKIPDPINRACAILWSLYGLSYIDIGFIFGVHESRICQRISSIKDSLLNHKRATRKRNEKFDV